MVQPNFQGTDSTNDSVIDRITGKFTYNMAGIIRAMMYGNEKITTIANMVKKDTGNVTRTLNTLIRKDLAKKIPDTTSYYVTPFGVKAYLEYIEIRDGEMTANFSSGESIDSKKVIKPKPKKVDVGPFRAENVGLKFKILEKPNNWGYDRRRIFIEKNLSEIKVNDKLKNWEQVSFRLEDVLVKTSNKHLLLALPKKNYDRRISKIALDLMNAAYDLKKKLERKLDIVLSDEIEFVGIELADIEDLVAKELPEEFEAHRNYVVWKDPIKGKERLKFDRSPGNWEFEYAMAEWSIDDAIEILRRRADEVLHPDMPLASEIAFIVEQQGFEISELKSELENDRRFSFKSKEALYNAIVKITETLNLLERRTFDPLDELKKRLKSEKDVQEYEKVIQSLDEKQQLEINEWINKTIRSYT